MYYITILFFVNNIVMEIIPISELRGGSKENPRQNDDYLPQFNFRMLLIGGSGSGKQQ